MRAVPGRRGWLGIPTRVFLTRGISRREVEVGHGAWHAD